MRSLVILLIVIIVAATALDASAEAPTFFTDRAAFEAAAGAPLSFEGFEGPWTDSGGVAVLAGFSVTETGGINDLFHATEAGGASFSVTEGVDSLWYDDNGVSVSTFFSFDSPVEAFGLDMTFRYSPTETVTIGGSVASSIGLLENTPSFWGVIAPDGISVLTFDLSGDGEIGFDAVAYVPEPATMSLLALGGLALLRRRKK